MAARVGNGPSLGAPGTPVLIPVDPRRDMMKELIAARLVAELADIESVLREIVTRGEAQQSQKAGAVRKGEQKQADKAVDRRLTETFERGVRQDVARRDLRDVPSAPKDASRPEGRLDISPPPTSEQVQRALQNLQREAGLLVTGRFDDATAQLLRNLGVVPSTPPATTTAPATTPAESAAPVERKPVDPAQRAAVRAKTSAAEAQQKTRVQRAPVPSSSKQEPQKEPRTDRVIDPARLLVSLLAAGFSGEGPEQALQAFQRAQQLPPSGQLDARTLDALVAGGHLTAQAAASHRETASHREAPSAPTASAAGGAASRASADKARADTTRPQPATSTATKPSDLVVRAQASSPEEARERARLESLLAQAAAKERGVQEGTGDPAALVGHGVNAGSATGISGTGGSGGGADEDGDEGALSDDDGSRGDESSNANAHAGDDDHDDGRRGEASDVPGDVDDEDAGLPDGHYRVPRLGVQVRAALDDIFRLDDGSVPVHYTWDVSLYRPGVYSAGMPAEVLWHLVVDRAHAFDPVWQRAVDAIAGRLLYLDPDADPLTLDDVLAALRRARVR